MWRRLMHDTFLISGRVWNDLLASSGLRPLPYESDIADTVASSSAASGSQKER